MQEVADMELLRQYTHRKSEAAFAALVTRHMNLVYSAALRKIGNTQAAEEIAQAVFIILAKKAGRLGDGTILSGWLYQTARLTSASFLRTEIRRTRREQEAYMQSLANEPEANDWPQIEPLLDDAMGELNEKERNAVVLRFFEGKSFQEIGTAFGGSENAAKKRVIRGLEKLRKFFTKRGVSSTTAIIAGAITANSVQAAPVALAKSVTAVAIAKGAAASGSTLTLIKGALKLMAWAKAKAAVTGAIIILVVGTTTLIIRHHARTRTDFPKSSWTLAGYGDPVSALRTVLWAGSRGDGKTVFASMTPDLRNQFQQRFADELKGRNVSLEQFFSLTTKERLSEITGFRVLNLEIITKDQIFLHLYIQGKEREDIFKLKKIGNEWKLDDFPKDY